MATKDTSSSSKDALLKDLKSLKSSLDEDDDNVPLLLDDEDIPVLGGVEDDDIPILDSPELPDAEAANKASLEAALRQLESMELAPKSRKTTSRLPPSIEETIRANAAPPIISNEELTRVRENPFLNANQKAQLDANRKLREEAQQAAAKATASSQKPAAQKPAPPQEEVIEFTDNPFLKASVSPVGVKTASAMATPAASSQEAEDGAAEILKELGEDARPYQPRSAIKAPVVEPKPANAKAEDDGFGDIILEDDKPAMPDKKDIDLIVDEIVDEYMVVLEAALRKKLKDKLPDLLK